MTFDLTRRASSVALLSTLAGAALAPAAYARSAAASAKFDADRKAILAMAGDYHVRFDFRETVPFRDDYDPIEPKVSGGNEVVRVVEDQGDVIRLQHILVIGEGKDAALVKHWRQDWTFEPRNVLAYEHLSQWKLTDVARADRAGAWSQTVWQTDDSPRYGGVGLWRHDDGVSAWTSEATLRPLARRDAVRKPPYDHYRGINRHALTPTGWVHQQENSKIGMRDGKAVTFVDESVINTYDRASDFPASVAEAYWEKTRAYWNAVRAEWDRVIAAGRGVYVEEEADNGAITGPRLMGLADKIAEGGQKTDVAISEAQQVIRGAIKLG